MKNTRDDSALPSISRTSSSGATPQQTGPAGAGEPYAGFEVKGELGRGGFGAVYLARELATRRDVALKTSNDPGRRRQSKQIARFLEEAYVTAQLQHPGVVPVYQIAKAGSDLPYYTMRPIEGQTLKDILDKLRQDDPRTAERFPLRRLIQVFQSCCQTVRFAHDRGVIHRDLKPSNIVVGDYGEVLVIDWGLAKVIDSAKAAATVEDSANVWSLYQRNIESLRKKDDSSLEVTADGQVMGTPAYLSPEQAMGRVGDLRAATDIWSLGVVLYELCTLRLPFEGGTVKEMLSQIVAAEPRDPMQAGPGRHVPSDLAAFAMRCLRRKVGERYASVAELLEDVTNWLEGVTPWRVALDLDFSRMPGLPAGWKQVGGRDGGWGIEGGQLRHKGQDNLLVPDVQVGGDIRLEFEAMVPEGSSGEITCLLCRPETASRTGKGYLVQFGREYNSNARMARNQSECARADVRYTPGRWHKVVAQRLGDTILLSVDGQGVLRSRDVAPLVGRFVGLYGWGDGPCVRRLRLESRGLPIAVSCLEVPKALYAKGLYEDARTAYLQIADDHSSREEGLEALFQAGRSSLRMADAKGLEVDKRQQFMDEAFGCFDRIEHSHLAPMGCLGKSMIHAACGRTRAEIAELVRAYEQYPGYDSLKSVGNHLWDRAQEFASRIDKPRSGLFAMEAVRLCPAGGQSNNALLAVAAIPGIKAALRLLRDAVRGEPLPAGYWPRMHLAKTLYWDHKYKEAIAIAQEIVDWPAIDNGVRTAAFDVIASCLLAQGRFEECVTIASTFLSKGGKNSRVSMQYHIGMAYQAWGRWDLAEKSFTEATAESNRDLPSFEYSRWGFAICCIGERKFEEATSLLKDILANTACPVPLRYKADNSLGTVLVLEGRYDDALRHYDAVIEKYRDKAGLFETFRCMAFAHALAGRRAEVIDSLKRSVEEGFDWSAQRVLEAPSLSEAAKSRSNTTGSPFVYEHALALAAYGRGDDAFAIAWMRRCSNSFAFWEGNLLATELLKKLQGERSK